MPGFNALGRLALGQVVETPSLEASVGSYALNGQSLLFTTTLAAGTGSYALTGQDAVFLGTWPNGTGSYALNGQTVAFTVTLPVTAGSYTLTGQDAAFVVTLAAGLGSYSLSGQSIATAEVMSATAGSYTLSGQVITFGIGFGSQATQSVNLLGAAALGETAVGELHFNFVGLDTGHYDLTGVAVTFSVTMPVDTGAALGFRNLIGAAALGMVPLGGSAEGLLVQGRYVLAGQAVALTPTTVAGTGLYTLTGFDVTDVDGSIYSALRVRAGGTDRKIAEPLSHKRRRARERATQDNWKRAHEQRLRQAQEAKDRAAAAKRAAQAKTLAELDRVLREIAAVRAEALARDDEDALVLLLAASEQAVEAAELAAPQAQLAALSALLADITAAYAPIALAAQLANDDEEALILLMAA